MLQYYLDEHEHEQEKYQDKDNKLSKDLRDNWWKKFGQAKGKPYKKIPKELKTDSLTPITREPLLNDLVALSYQREKVNFNENTTLNTIYKDLLDAVYERQWGDNDQHKMADDLTRPQFFPNFRRNSPGCLARSWSYSKSICYL